MLKTSVIFPARNEEILIKDAVMNVYKHLKKKKYLFEIIIVINGCNDSTEEIVKRLSNKYKEVIVVKSQPGYGYALRKGLECSRGEYVVIYNVDFYNLNLIDLIDINLYGRDFIIGSKRAHWSNDKRSLYRRIISSLFNNYLKFFHGFKGSDTHGIKVLKRELLKKIYDKCNTTSGIFDTELVIISQLNGARMADFPVDVEEVRPPRFVARVLQTPVDILKLHKSLTDYKKSHANVNKELFYDNFTEIWERKINRSETNKRLKIVYDEMFEDIDLKNKKFLDVGCGLGYFTDIAYKKGAKVTAIDIGSKLIKRMKSKSTKVNYVVASAQKIPFKDNYFDIVLSTEVIEHTEKPLLAIQEMKRVTKRNGLLLITTPNKLFKPLFNLLNLLKIRPYKGNENWFYPWELRKILVEGNFQIIKERYFNFLFPNNFLDKLENNKFSSFITINQGYLIRKK